MPSQSRKLNVERILLSVVGFSEIAGATQAWGISMSRIGIPFTSWGFTFPLIVQISFFIFWCLIQAYVTLFLIIQVLYASAQKDKHLLVFTNAVIICTAIQIFGFLQSMQVFGASVALTNAIFLYIYRKNEHNRNRSAIIAQARTHQSDSQ